MGVLICVTYIIIICLLGLLDDRIVSTKLEMAMTTTLNENTLDNKETVAKWQDLQIAHKCCGVRNYTDSLPIPLSGMVS